MISRIKIERILREADIEGFIASGAPEDEYNSEAADIAEALEKTPSSDLDADKVLTVICDVWMKSFGHFLEETEKVKPRFREIVRSLFS